MDKQGSIDFNSLLTEENCESTSRIRRFLRLSRLATDDTVKQHLNELKSTNACDQYFRAHIVPEWIRRSTLIGFCGQYSERLRSQNPLSATDDDPGAATNDVENKDLQMTLRMDPYAQRNEQEHYKARFAKRDAIEVWVRNEAEIEDIVRQQTSEVFSDKCYYRDWLSEFQKASK